MRLNFLKGLLSLGLLFALFSFAPSDWVKLGTRTVDFGIDHDIIHVGVKDGTFSKLKVNVTGGAMNMHKMKITYGDGSHQDVSLKHNFAKGSDTRIIDLTGTKRVIKKVEFWYDTKNAARRKAIIRLFGKH